MCFSFMTSLAMLLHFVWKKSVAIDTITKTIFIFVKQLKHQSRIILFDLNMGNKITNLVLLQWIGYPYLGVKYVTTKNHKLLLKKFQNLKQLATLIIYMCVSLTVSGISITVFVTTYKIKDEKKDITLLHH